MHAPHADRPRLRLILLRHAKSAYPDDIADHERPLAARGRHEAGLAGAWLRGTQQPIDAVLCSSAVRAQETLQRTGIAAPTTVEPRLYGAVVAEIIAVLHDVPSEVGTLLVVGHAPGLPDTAAALAGAGSDPEVVAALLRKFPTSAVAVLSFPGPWPALEAEGCRLVDMHVARD